MVPAVSVNNLIYNTIFLYNHYKWAILVDLEEVLLIITEKNKMQKRRHNIIQFYKTKKYTYVFTRVYVYWQADNKETGWVKYGEK